MWKEAYPKVTFVVQHSLQDCRHELLIANSNGIPTLLQHGRGDNNVPVFHSRRMKQLTSQVAPDISTKYVELESKDHWFDGVMSTPSLAKFYADLLGDPAGWPELPRKFAIIVANPSNMGPRGGLAVDQLISPDQVGKIEIERVTSSTTWILKTSNVLRFHFCPTGASGNPPDIIIVDKCKLVIDSQWNRSKVGSWLVRTLEGAWQVSMKHSCWKENRWCSRNQVSQSQHWLSEQRYGRQLGSLTSVLQTSGRLLLRTFCTETYDVTLQISRNLFQ